MKPAKYYFLISIRVILGLVFIFSGITKIFSPLKFAQDILNYQIVSEEVAFWTALILPWLELLCGIFLITGVLLQGSSFLISSMLLIFIILISTVISRGQEIDCGCFGFLRHKADFSLLIQDLVLFLLSFTILIFSIKKESWR